MRSILALVIASGAAAQECVPGDLLVVLDKSSSMTYAIGGVPKWDIAVDAIEAILGSYDGSIRFGLMMFPDPGECSPGAVQVDIGDDTADALLAALADPPPAGGNWTPMAQSLDVAAAYEPLLGSPKPNVLLITDGWQWCDPYDPATRFQPVDSVAALAALGLTVWVVGFGDGVDVLTLNMMADETGTALPDCDPSNETFDGPNCYYQADGADELLGALDEIAQEVTKEVCNAVDDDCDGLVDEDLVVGCETECGVGTSACADGAWLDCSAGVAPCPGDEPGGPVVPANPVDGTPEGEAESEDEAGGGSAETGGRTVEHDDLGGDVVGGCGCSLGARG